MIEKEPKKLIKRIEKATQPHLHNDKVYFLLTEKIKRGQSEFRNNWLINPMNNLGIDDNDTNYY